MDEEFDIYAYGAAAAATGAQVEGSSTTARILRLRAFGGLIKSGIINPSILISITSRNVFIHVLLVFVSSTFGAAVLVTLAMSQEVLAPNALIIAAAAGAPLMVGTVMLQTTGPVVTIGSIGWDAPSGYTFARVVQNHGYHICEYKSAAAAGAVFGGLVWIIKLPFSHVMKQEEENRPQA
ncbi:hypothetical protein B7463_g98, partial [Scytalidium lignicola]